MAETIDTKIWNSTRILYGYLYDSDEEGCLANIDDWQDSSSKFYRQRFYAAMRAYGKKPEWFYRREGLWSDNSDTCCGLLSQSRSNEKMDEFRKIVKENLKPGNTRYDFFSKVIDGPDYLIHDIQVKIVFRELIGYRKRLQAAIDIWSGMMECSQSIGSICELTRDLNRKYLWPLCVIVDRMIILLMGDDYDKTFTEEELYEYGYPRISDEELYKMEVEEW